MPQMTIPLAGAQPNRRTSSREFTLGTPSLGDGNKTYVYVFAAAAVPAATCTVDASFGVNSAAGNYTADVAFAAGEYGWVRKTTSPL